MINRFTPKSQDALEAAKLQAEKMGHTYIGTEHLLLGIMCTECIGARLLDEKGALYSKIFDQVVEISGSGEECSVGASLTPKCKKILENALAFAKKLGGKCVGTEHILYAICDEIDCVASRILSSIGISTQGLKNDISSLSEAMLFSAKKGADEIFTSSILSAYGKNLSSASSLDKADPLIGRDADVLRLIQVLCKKTKNNPCLIGEPGVGKTAIVEGLAKMISDGNVPSELENKIIVSLDLASMVAGTKYRGEFEERMRAVLNEVKASSRIILFVDEIHTIMGAGGAEGAIDAANIIKPSLARGEIRVIGATTTDEYRRYIERDSALERRFQPILIEEPSEDEAIDILTGLRPRYEAHHRVKISNEAILSAVRLSNRYINDRYLPDKAIDLLDEACARLRTSSSSKSDAVRELEKELSACSSEKENAILDKNIELATSLRDKEAMILIRLKKEKEKYQLETAGSLPCVSENDICEIITQQTKIPISINEKADNKALLMLESTLSRHIIGQDEAIKAVSSAIKRGRLGIKDQRRPCASFLFLGPTGVGKTELAKQIAMTFSSDKESFIRLDMSEYSEKHSISRLIGAPAGYVGYEDAGKLTEAVRRHAHSVVLFDEIEKAHPDIYNILLQILDDGTLTDSHGKKVNFKNTIIILTSNIGVSKSSSLSLGFDSTVDGVKSRQKEKISSELKHVFSPELLNRFDEVVIFNSLSYENARKICALMLNELSSRLKEIKISLSFSDEVVAHILDKGYSKEYGARNLRRAIVSNIENPLCEAILNEKISKSGKVSAILKNGSICYE